MRSCCCTRWELHDFDCIQSDWPRPRTATLTITDDAQGSPQSVSLSAIANPAFTAGAAPGGATTASVTAGQMAQYLLQLTPGPGYSGSVSLACSGAPLGATCYVPSSVSVANSAPSPFTVTVATSGGASLPPSILIRFTPVSGQRVLPLLALGLVLLVAIKNLRRLGNAEGRGRLTRCSALTVAVFCVFLGIAGCGGGSAPSHSNPSLRQRELQQLSLHQRRCRPQGSPWNCSPFRSS